MPVVISPTNCANCDRPYQVNYQDRRQSRMPLRGWIVLAVGIASTVTAYFAMVIFFGLAGLMYGFIFALAPAAIAWRYSIGLPRLMQVPCRGCGTITTCSIRETGRSPAETVKAVPGSTATAYAVEDDYAAEKLVRAKIRKKKAASKSTDEPPNPDFDFSQPDRIDSEPLPPKVQRPETSDGIEPD